MPPSATTPDAAAATIGSLSFTDGIPDPGTADGLLDALVQEQPADSAGNTFEPDVCDTPTVRSTADHTLKPTHDSGRPRPFRDGRSEP